MLRLACAVAAILLLAGGHAGGDRADPAPALPLVTVAADTAGMSELLNAERQRQGRAPLKRSRKLDRVAAKHATDMARKGYFSHYAPDGSTPLKRTRRAGYRACLTAENISYGRTSVPKVVTAWMNSPGHRKNILLREFTEFGAARAPGNIWVLVLARPGC